MAPFKEPRTSEPRRVIAHGDEGIITEQGGVVRKELREYPEPDGLPARPSRNAIADFYGHKIADALFPGHFIQYHRATRKVVSPAGKAPSKIMSRLINTTPQHQSYVTWFYRRRDKQLETGVVHSGEYIDDTTPIGAIKHYQNFDRPELREFVGRMIDRGVMPIFDPVNVDFFRGKPFFFEVDLHPDLVRKTANDLPREKRERILKWLERYVAATKTNRVYTKE